ncbi:methyl-CpG-binding domain-containing protein 2-like isoform X2 [Lycium ferocissimum]|uniref:methyl-CpG-binding domain-containing protein 2-like isoform X2 n=1 Tax=Lycium ferocissimum TaxID=112874 RepID=UPI0028165AB3|nr:methyl-CpG-binding domain-containing protein 2-like isoform X2 [Lycium ferocissimum]
MERDFLDLATPGKTDHNDIHGSSVASHRDNMKHEPKDSRDSARPGVIGTSNPNPIDVASSAEREEHSSDDEDNRIEDAQKQLVLYDPAAVGAGEIELVPDPVDSQPRRNSFPNYASRILPSVGAFTVQCANCFKWRLIPTKEKYEEIREHILEQPFYCETAREWRAEVSCDDPPDLTQDGSRLWAIDKPNIAQPPPGWERLLRIRGEGGTRFADVYYVAPSGKRLRSTVEVQKYLQEHPEYVAQGVSMSQFSFQIPRPLQENYVKKRPYRPALANDENDPVNRIAWIDQDGDTDLRLGMPELPAPCDRAPLFEPVSKSFKKKRTPSKRMSNADAGWKSS